MKLQAMPKQEIHRTGIDQSERKRFRVSTSAKTFKILSSTIYKHKIRAIIREISCNAIDGHVAAGITDPFDVQIPTVLDPRFIVRDYGVSLDDEQVQEMYTTYFESTKTESNDFIGALGLGSKSPFCYSDTFTVECVKDGVKRGYVAYMENGEPYVDKIYEVESDEPRGVAVIVPVKVDDISEWENEARRVYECFTGIRPNFVGVDPEVKYLPGPAEEGKNPLVKADSLYWKGLFARMGNILYPVDHDLYKGTLLDVYINQYRCNILDFDLGELDFMPSREELSLDKVTRQKILDKAGKMNRIYHTALMEQYVKCKTVREQLVFIHKQSDSIRVYMSKQADFLALNPEAFKTYTAMLNDKFYEEFEGLPGFWSNYRSASRCNYYVIGRTKKMRNETIRRQKLENIIHPWSQKKLLVIDMDEKSFTPALIGKAMKVFDNSYGSLYFVPWNPKSEESAAKIHRLIEAGMFDKSEVEYFTASEMTEEVALYREKNPKASRDNSRESDSETRPKTPTAVRYFIDDKGYLDHEDLFMTKKELRELPEVPAVCLYGLDDVYPLAGMDSKPNFDLSRLKSGDLDEIMVAAGVKEVYFVRNRLWDVIPESNLVCFDSVMTERTKEVLRSLKANNHKPDYSGCELGIVETMGVDLNRIIKAKTDETACEAARVLVRLLRKDSTMKPAVLHYAPLQKAYEKYITDRDAMQDRTKEAFKVVCEKNPFIGKLLSSFSDYRHMNVVRNIISNTSSDDLNKLIRWK